MNFLKNYKVLNNLVGWIVFLIAATVYLLTVEPTASWWDCGEYIATAFKLEVGHPPGAPLFQLMGRFFTLFANGDVSKVAVMVNSMSAILSGFTILFLFWSITAIAKKIYVKSSSYELTTPQTIIILGAGLVGALAYTFTDSFWFSAVEGEVYATSSFFTAIVFWAMLKWDVAAEEKHANRWIILIAFMMGLSIGVHLLNLLAIPAMTMIYYFRKGKQSKRNLILSMILSIVLLGFIQSGIIPWTVKLAGLMELFFVNSVGMPFNSGTIIYFILIVGLIVFGLWFTKKRGKTIFNTCILAFTFIIIGYSSFLMLVVRANANTPINENAPKDALTLLTYLNRDQYGDWPVLYGQYYNAKVIDTKEGASNYIKGKDKYIPTTRKINYVYDPASCGLFPRMWSEQDKHVKAYKAWTGIKGNRNPTFGENLEFFFKNQFGNQYWRYFMWNFVGRQNDIQGFGIDEAGNKDIVSGNWISGIKFLDAARLGNQDKITDKMLSNKGRNTFYFLPLLLGLAGMIYHYWKNKKDAFVVTLLFLLTGFAIIIYLNPTPYQPRERDYAYAGSFYAFAIWIGLGVIALYHLMSSKLPKIASAVIATILCLVLVPGIMGKQGWNDHDRSYKYAMRDFAKNYLASCAPNAILITNGDNDTFPLWYVQEVEGFRTDVRVVNFTLASGDWYIHQLFNKIYDSDPLPFTIPSDKYTAGTNDFVPYYAKDENNVWDLKKLINFINSDNKDNKVMLQDKREVAYIPTKNMSLKVDSLKVCNNGTVPSYLTDRVVKAITWQIKKGTLYKNDLMLLDLIATNNWERPIYFASPSSVSDFINIEDYCYLEGSVYRLIPVKGDNRRGGVLTDETYDAMMNKFAYGNLNDKRVYVDKESYGMALYMRNNFARLAQGLISEGKKDKALKVLDKGIEMFPDYAVPYDLYMIGYGELYFQLGQPKKANEIYDIIADIYDQNIEYYMSVEPKMARFFEEDTQQGLSVLQALMQYSEKNGEKEQGKKFGALLSKYIQVPTQDSGTTNPN
jgi:tetratricopeptide (TPR) repeat protein